MKRFAAVVLLTACATLFGCGSNSNNSANINGAWTAQLTEPTNGSQPEFTLGMALIVNGDNTLSINNFTITSPSPCFTSGKTTESGSFSLSGNFNGNVSGNFGMTVASTTGDSMLKLSGTANGNTISGTWTLTGTSGTFNCTGSGSFTMTRQS